MAPPAEHPLRRRRLECGLTQSELAARAGVSRQLVAAVEAGRNVPAVDAAMGLARALASTVEELFAGAPPDVVAALGGRPREGAALRVGRVADHIVVAELADHGTAGAVWAKPDAVIEGGALRMFDGATPAGLVVAGCDPALGVAEAMLQGLAHRSLMAISAPTGVALRALRRGGVHGAVVHGKPGTLPDPPVPVTRIHFARWQVGVALAQRLRRRSLEEILRGAAPVAQRDSAAGSQRAFEQAAASVGVTPPPGPRAAGHIEAARIAATLDGAAVTTESAARKFDLGFLALEDHVVEIWVAEQWREHPGFTALGELLTMASFTDRVTQFGGYDMAGCGAQVSASGAA